MPSRGKNVFVYVIVSAIAQHHHQEEPLHVKGVIFIANIVDIIDIIIFIVFVNITIINDDDHRYDDHHCHHQTLTQNHLQQLRASHASQSWFLDRLADLTLKIHKDNKDDGDDDMMMI